MVRLDDLKADIKEVTSEFKQHKIGIVGLSLIVFMVTIGLLAPVLAPGVAGEWSPGARRWRDNPASSPPVWLDWITRDDYARHTVEEWDDEVELSEWSYFESGKTSFNADLTFDELGDSRIEVRHGNRTLRDTAVRVTERPGIDNVTVENLNVEPVEGADWDFTPVPVTITADLIHDGTVEENRTLELEIIGDTVDYSWTLTPGEERQIEASHTFQLDGVYPVILGERVEVVTVGVGGNVEIIDFNLEETGDLEATMEAEVRNVGIEEETLQLRVMREGTQLTQERFDIEAGEQRSIIHTETFDIEGTYDFILGPERDSITFEQEEDTTAQAMGFSGSPDEHWEDEDESEEEMSLQQEDGSGLLVDPIDVPDEVTIGELVTVTVDIESYEEEAQEVSLWQDGEFVRDAVVPAGGDVRGHEITIPYEMNADRPPREIYMEYWGHAEMYRHRYIEISRPTHPWEFEEWTGDYEATEENITINMDEDKDIIAHFGEVKYEVRTTTLGNGTVEFEPDQRWYERGEEVTIEAVPETDAEGWDWEFSHWTGDYPEGEQYEEEITLEMDHDKSLRAAFQREGDAEYDLTFDVGDNGTVNLDGEEYGPGTHTYTGTEGEAVLLEAVPDEDHQFDLWSGDLSIREEEVSILLDEDKEVTASFDDQITYSLDITERGQGVVDIEPYQVNYEPGTEVTLSATPQDIMVMDDFDRGDRAGDIHEGITSVRRGDIRDRVYTQAFGWVTRQTDMEREDVARQADTHVTETIFSKRNENWLNDPDPLKGEYELTIRVDGIDIEIEEAHVTFSGAVYGVLGTDGSRRDIFQGWVWGARYGLYAGGIVALATILFSTSFGMTSAYYGGWVDEFMQRLNEVVMGIPTLPILIIVLQFWRRDINAFVLIYSLLMWRGAAKVIRSRGLQVAKDTYIEAAESLGSGSARIISKHMIPQILPYAIAQAALLVPVVIMAEAGLHILGLGDPGIVTWGTILNDAWDANVVMNWRESWFWILFPGLGMILVGFGFIATGMAIERIINPKMKQR